MVEMVNSNPPFKKGGNPSKGTMMQTNVNYAMRYTLATPKSKKRVVYGCNEKHLIDLATLIVVNCPGTRVEVICIDTGEKIFPAESW
jgi:hypothetical protein